MAGFPREHAPGDVFRDKDGRLWVVVAYCHEPTVAMKCVHSPFASCLEVGGEKRGGVTGAMWDGFTKMEPKS